MKYSKEQIARSEVFLKRTLKIRPGDKVYTVVKHVSRLGMMRHISAYLIRKGEPQDISISAATILEWPLIKNDSVRVDGCGMDMGFHLVYSLSHRLFPKGFNCIGEKRRCPANDHANGSRDYSKTTHHNDGGYALIQRWM